MKHQSQARSKTKSLSKEKPAQTKNLEKAETHEIPNAANPSPSLRRKPHEEVSRKKLSKTKKLIMTKKLRSKKQLRSKNQTTFIIIITWPEKLLPL